MPPTDPTTTTSEPSTTTTTEPSPSTSVFGPDWCDTTPLSDMEPSVGVACLNYHDVAGSRSYVTIVGFLLLALTGLTAMLSVLRGRR